MAKTKCYRCPDCDKIKPSAAVAGIRKHVVKFHSAGADDRECPVCLRRLRDWDALDKHCREAHPEKAAKAVTVRDPERRAFKCTGCSDFEHVVYRRVLAHYDLQHGELSKCDKCDYRAKFSSDMVTHRLRVHKPV